MFITLIGSASAYKEKIACENENLHLSCPRESKLDIIDASYGRDAGPEICPSDSIEVSDLNNLIKVGWYY